MISEPIDWIAHYFGVLDWFLSAKSTVAGHKNESALCSLLDELDKWSKDQKNNLTAIKWLLFWHFLKDDVNNPGRKMIPKLSKMYSEPFFIFWPTPDYDRWTNPPPVVKNLVKIYKDWYPRPGLSELIRYAAESTYDEVEAGFRVGDTVTDYLRYRVPFRGTDRNPVHYGGPGTPHSLKVSGFEGSEWNDGPEVPGRKGQPTRWAVSNGRLPILVRLPAHPNEEMVAWVRNNGIVSDLVNELPDFKSEQNLEHHDNSIRRTAIGQLTKLPMKIADFPKGVFSIVVSSGG